MNDHVLRDLEQWEKGELTRSELGARHPQTEDLLRLRDRLRELAATPLPSAGSAWTHVRPSLGPRPVARRFWRLAPAVALGAIALFASMGAVAAATVPDQTADAIDHVLHAVGHHPHGAHPPLHQPGAHPPIPTHLSDPTHAPSPSHTPASSHSPSPTHRP